MASYVVNFKTEEDIPFCIICQETIIENASHDLSYNEFCPCKFHYHQLCYEKWINLVKNEKCLICRKDISMNFIFTNPFNKKTNVITRRRPSFINITTMSPRTRYRYGIPWMYTPRRINIFDRLCNTLSCNYTEQHNTNVDWMFENFDCIVVFSLFICFIGIVVVIVSVVLVYKI